MQRKEPSLGWMLLWSAAIHLASYFLLVTFHLSSLSLREEPVYYVDIVNLPVANPRAGAPSSGTGERTPPPTGEEMVLPEKPSSQSAAQKQKPGEKSAAQKESEEEFQKRLSKMEKQAAAREFTNVLASLQNRAKNGGAPGRSGIPGGKGDEAGSDYAGYIRSRLMDAFKTTIAFQSKKPEALVRITIDRNGRIIGLRFVRKSNDRLFDDSVHRAILKAEQTFPPPPDGGRFEYSYRFAPEEVGKN